MLQFPTTGIARSVESHNVGLDVLCDWIELNVLFDEDRLSSTDVVDALCDGIYAKQDMAAQLVDDAWSELRRREACVGERASFTVHGQRVSRKHSWRQDHAHSFCILLAFAKWHRKWGQQFGANYGEQGELFELLTKESIQTQFVGWQVHQTGWSRTNAVKLAAVATDVAERLGETTGNIVRWGDPAANESGLDLVFYRPFSDNRVGIPVYLTQCASGADWTRKLKTPDLDLWNKLIDFAGMPHRAFATPFAFSDSDFIRNCNKVKGMLLYRYRLLAAATHKESWVSAALRKRIIAWAKPRIAALPRMES